MSTSKYSIHICLYIDKFTSRNIRYSGSLSYIRVHIHMYVYKKRKEIYIYIYILNRTVKQSKRLGTFRERERVRLAV